MDIEAYVSIHILTTSLLLVLTLVAVRLWKANKNLPPGPWGLPFFGYYPFLNKTHEDLLRLGQKYGPVSSFRSVGGRLVIVLNGAKTIKDVLVRRADEFDGRASGSSVVNWISDGLGIVQEEGDAWREHRRFWLQTAKSFGYGRQETESLIQERIQEMLQEFRNQCGKYVNLHLHLAVAANGIICQALFGKKMKVDNFETDLFDPLKKLIGLFVGARHFLVGHVFDLVMWLIPNAALFEQGKQSVNQLVRHEIGDQMQTFDPNNSRGYVDAYLKTRQDLLQKGQLDGGLFTMKRLQAITINMFFEGTESVSSTVDTMLRELSKHSQVQKTCQEELDSVVGRERLPCWADRPNLPFVDAVIQELYRVAGLFLITTMYSNFEETTIEGFRIPKRSVTVANLYSIHVDPEVYPNPDKFDPRRFLNEEGKRVKREGPYSFGLGKRSCIGESMAQMEVFLFLSSILQSFSLRPGNTEDTCKVVPRE